MLADGIQLIEGSLLTNAVVASGTAYPGFPNIGELFYRTDLLAMHVYNGTEWEQIGLTSSTLNGQPGSYYLDAANTTGTLSISHGGTGATTATAARTNLGLVIGTDVQAFDADLSSIAALSGTSGVLRKTAANTWSLDTTTYLPTTGGTIVGDITMTGNIIPSANNTYSLGSSSMVWKDIWVGPGSLYVNGKEVLSDVSNTIVFSTDINQNLRVATSGTGTLELQTDATGTIAVKGTLTITSGKKILDSAGVQVEFGDNIEMGSNKITGLGTPTLSTDAATKAYVDANSVTDTTIVRTSGDQTIAGNKTFSGTTTFNGTLNAAGNTVLFADNIIELNSDFTTGTPTEDAGFQVRRGDLGIVKFIWDETNDRFAMLDALGAYKDLYTTGTITATTFSGNATNATLAASATKLATARTINGTSFDGTANITVVAAAGTLTGTALASNVVASSLTSVGTLASLAVTGTVSAADPVQTTDLATKQYVDNLVQGLTWKLATKVATTANITLSGTQTIDGIALVAGDRVLVKNQTTATQNGIYVVASGAWTRSTDMDGAPNVGEVNGAAVFVDQGTVNGATSWTQNAVITTVGTQAMNFVQFGASVGPAAAGTLTGATLASNVVASSLTSVGTLSALAVSGAITSSNSVSVNGTVGTASFDTSGARVNFTRNTANYITASNAAGYLIFETGGNNNRFQIDSAGAATFSSSVAAASFSGAGTGLTGTAASLSIGGSAGSASQVPASGLTGTTIASNVTASSLTSLGTLTGLNSSGTITLTGGSATLRVGNGSIGYITVEPGTASTTGYTAFFSAAGNRQGYIGYSTTNTTGDTGTIPFVMGAASFSGNVNVAGTLTGNVTGNLTGTASTATNALQLGGVAAAGYPNNSTSTVNTNSTDWNTLVTHGEYQVGGNGTWTGSTNAPTSAYAYGLLEIHHVGSLVTQRYVTHNGSTTWIRSKYNASDWQTWRELLNSQNYTSYSPSLTGTGASGTWPISISGTANNSGLFNGFSSTDAFLNRGSVAGASQDTALSNGWYQQNDSGSTSGLLVFAPGGSLGTAQIRMAYQGDFQFRNKTDNATWNAWKTVLTNANYNSFSPTLTGGGASGTWAISISGNADTVDTYHASIAQSASTIPVRDGSGYVFLNYINSNTPNSENATVGQVITTTGSDNYYRKNSIANFTSQLSGTAPISITGDAATLGGISAARQIYGANGSGSNSASATQNVYELPQYKSGFWDANGANWTPDTGWWWGATFAHVSNSTSYNYNGQLAFKIDGGGDNVYARTTSGGTPTGWSRLLSSGNYNSYAPKLDGTGASGTWGINITGNAATASNVSSISNAVGTGYTWTGVQYFLSNFGASSYLGSNSSYRLEAYSTDGGAAAMSFHRSGAYAVNMGLDPDNVFRIGGWSASANRLELDMSGNLTTAGQITANGAVTATGAGGFKSSTYVTGARNPIWRFGNADGYGISYFQGTSGVGSNDTIGFHFGTATAAGSPVYITSAGNITIGGSFYASGDVTAFSDVRVKKDIEVIPNALEKVEQIRGVTFARSDIEDGKRHAGVIAQEVEAVLPEVVSEMVDGTKTVAYGNLTALLIEAVKELSAQNKALLARIEQLETK